MYTFLVIVIIIVAVLLAIAVLVQNSKGGGLAANFSAPNQVMGVRRAADFIEKATWILAAALVVLSLCATVAIPRHHAVQQNQSGLNVETPVQQAPAAPAATAPAPEQSAE